MRKRASWIVMLCLAAAAAAFAAAGGGGRLWNAALAMRQAHGGGLTPRPGMIPSGRQAEIAIPFQLIAKHVFVDVVVKGRHLAFLLDTGNRYAVIDKARAQEMGIELGDPVHVVGVGEGASVGAFVRSAELTMPGFAGFSQPVTLAIPLAPLAPRMGHDLDGLLGTEFIKAFVLELDYDARVIRLHDKETFVYRGPGQSLPIRFDAQGQPLVAGRITPMGRKPLEGQFKVDIGAGGALTLHSPFNAEHGLPGPDVRSVSATGGAGTGGPSKGRLGRVEALAIGSFLLRRPLTHFSEDTAGAFSQSAIQGNIGEEVLSRFKLFFDYGHGRIIFEPGKRFGETFERPWSGMRLEAEGEGYRGFRVTAVVAGSPAEGAGLAENDRILAIDERAAASLTLSEILDLFEAPATRKVTIQRGTQTRTVVLTPRPFV